MRFPLFARTGVGRGLALAIFGLVLAVSWSGVASAQEVKKLRVAVGRSSVLTLPEEQELMKALLDYPALIAGAAEALEPHRVATYLHDTAVKLYDGRVH